MRQELWFLLPIDSPLRDMVLCRQRAEDGILGSIVQPVQQQASPPVGVVWVAFRRQSLRG